MVLQARDLHKSFGATRALTGASLTVRQGEVLAVMGPSGSGKSTLLHCLAGILVPDEGQVVYEGQRVDMLSDRERTLLRRSTFGFVFQFGQLVPELPVVENIALPLLLNGTPRRDAIRTARQWLPMVGLDDVADRVPGELSGGQAQRIAVARALIAEPKIVFADEPTGALDSVASDEVMELLTGSARVRPATVVLVTHEPRVAAYADRTVIVRDGALSEPVGAP